MPSRRDFVKLAFAGAAGATLGRGTVANASEGVLPPADERAAWYRRAEKLAKPVLLALAQRQLKARMPVEVHRKSTGRKEVTHLEAIARLLAGLAPWLELGGDDSDEGHRRARWGELARQAIDAATDPKSPDFLNFTSDRQPLVDAAFLAQALRRAPRELWGKLEPRVQQNVIAALRSSRVITPFESNWLLFATTVEVFLQSVGVERDAERLWKGIRQHRAWYVGDGAYGDGPEFHWDYYNAFVIQPMLVEALDAVGDEASEWQAFRKLAGGRLTRYAEVQERMIATDGSFPPLGRSLAYRCGAFQGLALAALRGQLPEAVSPAQARVALGRVIRRTLDAAGTYDEDGWLRIGLDGAQPGLGEQYISTGSLYLCSVAFLPLGLPASDKFWRAPAVPTTWEKVWTGRDMPVDQALKEEKPG